MGRKMSKPTKYFKSDLPKLRYRELREIERGKRTYSGHTEINNINFVK